MTSKSFDIGPGDGYHFFRSQLTKPVLPPNGISIAGQTAILTGSNTGLGFACAKWLLELNVGRLIMAVRTLSKGEAAATELRKKYKGARIDIWQLDMLSYKSVQNFAAKCQALDRLDIAILNAGVIEQSFQLGPQGHEKMFQVNYLSTVLLAFLLLPILKGKSPKGIPGRLTVVGSCTAYFTKVPYRDSNPFLSTFDDKSKFNTSEQYPASKILAHFWIMKLAERVKKEDVIVNLVDPGLVKGTDINRSVNPIIKMMFDTVMWGLGRTMRNGSSTYIDAAILKGEETHGSYLMDWKIQPYATPLYDSEGESLATRIWDETLEELSFANIKGILSNME
ncbi:NAD(P)-binding protein [Trichoderma evansii]